MRSLKKGWAKASKPYRTKNGTPVQRKGHQVKRKGSAFLKRPVKV